MAFDRSALLSRHRRALHDTLSILAVLKSRADGAEESVRVRWHAKTVINGDLTFQGWAQEIEGLHSIIFDRKELAEKNIEPKRGDSVSAFGVVLSLDSLEPTSNEVDEVWRVVQQ